MIKYEIGTINNLQNKVLVVLDNEKVTLSPSEAISLSIERGLDLIKVSDKEDFSVCRLIDVKKEQYKIQKIKKNKIPKLKEFRFGYNIAEHDIDIKVKQIYSFLKSGDSIVKIVIRGNKRLSTKHMMLEQINLILSKIPCEFSKIKDIVADNANCSVQISCLK